MTQLPADTKKGQRRKITIIFLFVILASLSLVAATGEMGQLETQVFDWIYTMPESLHWFALIATQLGNIWVAMGVVGLLFVVRWNPTPSLIVLKNAILAYLVVEFLKFVVSRPRPAILLSEVTSREIAVFGNGFPSGHTALATVLSLSLWPYLPPKFRWLPFVWIGLVAWSRIYLGVHAPLDVVGGLVIGLLIMLAAEAIPWPPKKSSQK